LVVIQILSFLFGLAIVIATIVSAIRTFVLPRSAPDIFSAIVFKGMRRIFNVPMHWAKTYEDRDRIMAFFAPISVLMLLPMWLSLVLLGYMFMFWSFGVTGIDNLFAISGSSLLTLGTHPPENITDDVPCLFRGYAWADPCRVVDRLRPDHLQRLFPTGDCCQLARGARRLTALSN
jgi:hypothetical protein